MRTTPRCRCQTCDVSDTLGDAETPADDAPRQSNPPWTWDEEILAFDLYDRVGMVNDRHPDVIALSVLLLELPIYPSEARTGTFRNPAGVARKLADIGTRDPRNAHLQPTSGSRLDREVW